MNHAEIVLFIMGILTIALQTCAPNPPKTTICRELILDCSNFQEVDKHCHLGAVFNKSLIWESHIDYICNKINTTLYAMKTLK